MDLRETRERIFDNHLIVERIVWLRVQTVDHLPDDLFEWLTESAMPTLAAALDVAQDDLERHLDAYGTSEGARKEALTEALRRIPGWLVELSAPRIDWRDSGSGSVHLGWRTMTVTYADTVEAALEEAIAWGEEFTAQPAAATP